MGECLGRALDAQPSLANGELSLLLAARRLGIPLSVHAALGAEIIHQHPAANGAAIGDTSHRDFRRLAHSLTSLDDGGVVLNLGSAVIMPRNQCDGQDVFAVRQAVGEAVERARKEQIPTLLEIRTYRFMIP